MALMAHRPVILDEPTNDLDPAYRNWFGQTHGNQPLATTIILVTHNVNDEKVLRRGHKTKEKSALRQHC